MPVRLSACFEFRRKRTMRLSWFGAGRSEGVSRGSARGRVGVLLAGAVVAAAAVVAGAGPVSAQEGFEDSGSGVHRPNIDALAEMGVFEGTECGTGLFCPGEPVSRWVMAVWLVRVLDGADPEAGGGIAFRRCGRQCVVVGACRAVGRVEGHVWGARWQCRSVLTIR